MSEKLPIVAETVLKGTYMGDSLDSFESEIEAKEAHNQLVQLWTSFGMKARKCILNSTKVLVPFRRRTELKSKNCQMNCPVE